MSSRLQNSQQERTHNNNLPATQSRHNPTTQDEQADQYEINQETSDH